MSYTHPEDEVIAPDNPTPTVWHEDPELADHLNDYRYERQA